MSNKLPSPDCAKYAYEAWPTLVRMRNRSDVLLVYSAGRSGHVTPYGRIELRRTQDLGASWTHPRVVFDGPVDDRDPGIVETKNRSLLLTWKSSFADSGVPPDLQQRFNPEHSTARDYIGEWMARSTDGGLSWSAPYRVDLHAPHGPIQLSNGQLMYYGKGTGGIVFIGRSDDDGLTWRRSSFSANTGAVGSHLTELHAVETATAGRVILHIREQSNGGSDHSFITQFISNDFGMSWEPTGRVSEDGEHPSHLLRLEDGRIVFTTSRRLAIPHRGIIYRVSDEGNQWSAPIVLATIPSNGGGWDLGYPTTVQLPGMGRLLTVWYERPNGASVATLAQHRWQVPR